PKCRAWAPWNCRSSCAPGSAFKIKEKRSAMKLMYFDDYRLGVVKGGGVADITEIAKSVPHRDNLDLIAGVIEQFDRLRPEIEAAVADAPIIPLAQVQIRAPLPRPRQIDCMAT